MGQRTCTIEGCTRIHDANGFCSTHWGRLSRTGEALRPCATCGQDCDGRAKYCSPGCRPECEIDGCRRLVKTRDRCSSHYDDLLKEEITGAPRAYRWATERRCVVCGATDWAGKRRKACSGRCQQLLARGGGIPPSLVSECVRCGAAIDLTVRGKSGRKKRADTKMCDWCRKSKSTRHLTSVTELLNAAGGDSTCGICGDLIDMTLMHPDLFRASVDHIQPYSLGGTHDLSNLQLAHLYCNYLKSNREGFVI